VFVDSRDDDAAYGFDALRVVLVVLLVSSSVLGRAAMRSGR
jgi:hypothetical protein